MLWKGLRRWKLLGREIRMAKAIDPQVKLWMHLVKNGRKSLKDVPEKLRTAVKKEMNKKA